MSSSKWCRRGLIQRPLSQAVINYNLLSYCRRTQYKFAYLLIWLSLTEYIVSVQTTGVIHLICTPRMCYRNNNLWAHPNSKPQIPSAYDTSDISARINRAYRVRKVLCHSAASIYILCFWYVMSSCNIAVKYALRLNIKKKKLNRDILKHCLVVRLEKYSQFKNIYRSARVVSDPSTSDPCRLFEPAATGL